MTGPKITIVGGGSYSWGPLFVRDLLIAPALQNAEIVLHDVDAQALETVYSLGRAMVQQRGQGRVERTLDLEAALRGADFVILTITTGGLEAMRHDVEIPEKYGVFQAVGDTVGPGGLVRALRNIPVVATLAQKMEQLCPHAWLLNYTNPMTTLCRTVSKTSSHSHDRAVSRVARGARPARRLLWRAGIRAYAAHRRHQPPAMAA